LYDYGGNNNYSVRRIKLEKGTLATDWSPAPEDAQTQVTETQESLRGLELKFETFKEQQFTKEEFNSKDCITGSTEYQILKHQVESLVKQTQTLQEQLALVKPAPRRAPMAYTLDRTTVPWTIWFDNGCGLQLPSYAETATIYGYGQSINLQNKEWVAFPLVGNIISLSNGNLTLDNVKNTVDAIYWADDTTVLNPIKNKDDHSWLTARCGEKSSKPQWAWEREANVIRIMYELGIWDAKTVESLGAVRR